LSTSSGGGERERYSRGAAANPSRTLRTNLSMNPPDAAPGEVCQAATGEVTLNPVLSASLDAPQRKDGESDAFLYAVDTGSDRFRSLIR
jgi:hypothetical protein